MKMWIIVSLLIAYHANAISQDIVNAITYYESRHIFWVYWCPSNNLKLYGESNKKEHNVYNSLTQLANINMKNYFVTQYDKMYKMCTFGLMQISPDTAIHTWKLYPKKFKLLTHIRNKYIAGLLLFVPWINTATGVQHLEWLKTKNNNIYEVINGYSMGNYHPNKHNKHSKYLNAIRKRVDIDNYIFISIK